MTKSSLTIEFGVVSCYAIEMEISKRKLFINLFPSKWNMMGFNDTAAELINSAIKKRYVQKGFEYAVVQEGDYRNTGILLYPDHNIRAKVDHDYQRKLKDGITDIQYCDFAGLAEHLLPEDYSEIALAGFHAFDCVSKLSHNLYKRNKNTMVDIDLTELFLDIAMKRDSNDKRVANPEFNVGEYDPVKTYKFIIGSGIYSPEGVKIVREAFTHPTYNLGKEVE